MQSITSVISIVATLFALVVAYESLEAQRAINRDQMELNKGQRERDRRRNAEKVNLVATSHPTTSRHAATLKVFNRSTSPLIGVRIRVVALIIQGGESNPATKAQRRMWLASDIAPCSVATLKVDNLPPNIVRPAENTNIDGPVAWVFLLTFTDVEYEWTIENNRLLPLSPDTLEEEYRRLVGESPFPELEIREAETVGPGEALDCV
ncbi:hypothetical protein O7628_32105 [Micromonospora sp. WMMD956]|uniref:hypothetical protein n=1 Tax=Micromonospora sp. WMMD956 TaxID=3016108 RepID=UPI0024159DBA|nr:hypothetical protein [Micromonospora sp. WMMD956]MDG4820151.1 hypothetical protein [Micromonospora sp. WMMD956]